MGRSRVTGAEVDGVNFGAGFRMRSLTLTLGGTTALLAGGPPALYLDTNGAGRTVKMPAAPKDGDTYLMFNTASAANSITVQDSAGVALSPALVIPQSKSALIQWNATLAAWRFLLSA